MLMSMPVYDIGTVQKVSFDGSVASAAVIGANAVLLISDQACAIEFGSAPTAVVADNFVIPANVPIAFTCAPTDKVAAIKNTGASAGILQVIPLNV